MTTTTTTATVETVAIRLEDAPFPAPAAEDRVPAFTARHLPPPAELLDAAKSAALRMLDADGWTAERFYDWQWVLAADDAEVQAQALCGDVLDDVMEGWVERRVPTLFLTHPRRGTHIIDVKDWVLDPIDYALDLTED